MMRNHLWMHTGLLAAILAVFGLGAAGVAVPKAVIVLVVLACPLTMVFMMRGMNHGNDAPDESNGRSGAGDGLPGRQTGLSGSATASGRTDSRLLRS